MWLLEPPVVQTFQTWPLSCATISLGTTPHTSTSLATPRPSWHHLRTSQCNFWWESTQSAKGKAGLTTTTINQSSAYENGDIEGKRSSAPIYVIVLVDVDFLYAHQQWWNGYEKDIGTGTISIRNLATSTKSIIVTMQRVQLLVMSPLGNSTIWKRKNDSAIQILQQL